MGDKRTIIGSDINHCGSHFVLSILAGIKYMFLAFRKDRLIDMAWLIIQINQLANKFLLSWTRTPLRT